MNPDQNPLPQQPSNDPVARQSAYNPVQQVGPVHVMSQAQVPFQDEQPKQPHRKLLIIIGAIFFIILAMGAVGYFLFATGAPQSKDSSSTSQATPEPRETAIEKPAQGQVSEPPVNQAQFDTAHKNNASKFTSAVETYTNSNNGKLPAVADINDVFIAKYLNGTFDNPSTGKRYKITEANPLAGEIQYKTSSGCAPDNNITSGSKRQVAVRLLLSTGAYYCVSN